MSTDFVKRESNFDREARLSEQLFKKLSWKLHSLDTVEVYVHRDFEDLLIVDADTKQPICMVEVMDGEILVWSLDGTKQLAYPDDVSECRTAIKQLAASAKHPAPQLTEELNND